MSADVPDAWNHFKTLSHVALRGCIQRGSVNMSLTRVNTVIRNHKSLKDVFPPRVSNNFDVKRLDTPTDCGGQNSVHEFRSLKGLSTQHLWPHGVGLLWVLGTKHQAPLLSW